MPAAGKKTLTIPLSRRPKALPLFSKTVKIINWQLANLTQGDLSEIEPAAPYTEQDLDYNNQNSRVYLEHADPAKQAVALKTNSPQGWAEYSTVYVGYPIWWGSAA